MKVYILYRPNSQHERQALNYIQDFARQTGKQLPMLNPDSPQGAEISRLYDIVQYPAIIVTDAEGRMQNMWTGDQLPTYSELSYYVADEPQKAYEK